jgi:hypothetical protein
VGLQLLRCADRLAHSTTVQGRPNTWGGYNCTARADSGRETLYAFRSDQDCQVEVRLVDLTTDLDLFLLDCDPTLCGSCSWSPEGFAVPEICVSTPLDLQERQGGEMFAFDALAGQVHGVVVDGYAQSEGTYTIEVDCVCP